MGQGFFDVQFPELSAFTVVGLCDRCVPSCRKGVIVFGELVTTNTGDRVRLDGFLVPAAEGSQNDCEIDAAVISHGLSGNFYGSRLLKHLAKVYSQAGIPSVIINTRGHDYVNLTVQAGRSSTLGAAFEIVDDCKHDLFGWSQFLVDRGYRRVLLSGHSLGAIKSLYAQAHQPHPNVVAVAGLSATRLSYDSLLASPGGEQFRHWLQIAQQQVAAGQGDALIKVDFPFPTWMSANAYLAKYDSGDKYNWLSFADRIQVPTWLGFGQMELDENPAFVGLQPELDRIVGEYDHFKIDTIPGADHFYSARSQQATGKLMEWLRSL